MSKKEKVHLIKYFDFDGTRLAVFEYIEAWYNKRRIHSSIDYISPQKYEYLARRIA
ncbi:IS3 family transposase [Clostridium sporogenes]